MAKPFPLDNPFLNGYYAPLHIEGDAQNLPVTGELPRQLVGTMRAKWTPGRSRSCSCRIACPRCSMATGGPGSRS